MEKNTVSQPHNFVFILLAKHEMRSLLVCGPHLDIFVLLLRVVELRIGLLSTLQSEELLVDCSRQGFISIEY